MKKKLDLYAFLFVYCSIGFKIFDIFAVQVSREIHWLSKSKGVGQFHNTAQERGAHTCIVCNNIISVPQHSLLTIAHISNDKRRRNIQCAQYWKWEGHPRLLERGISSTPYTVRPIGLHSLATIRFQKRLNGYIDILPNTIGGIVAKAPQFLLLSYGAFLLHIVTI